MHGIACCTGSFSQEELSKIQTILLSRKQKTRTEPFQLVCPDPQSLKQIADEKWARFFLAESVSFRKIDSIWFKEAHDASVAAGNSYQPPNRRNLCGQLLNQCIASIEQTNELNIYSHIDKTGIYRLN